MCQNAQVRPQSPCTKICTLDGSGLCVGCLRTLTEIANWAGMTSEEQWRLLGVLDERRQRRMQSEPAVKAPAEPR
jgi:predicted Fe-S protein YdhL (DUF1289 family)